MSRLDLPAPVRMQRVAVAAPSVNLRSTLVRLARSGTLETAGELPAAEGPAQEALRRLGAVGPGRDGEAALSPEEPDLAALESSGARDLLRGELELDRRRRLAIEQGDVSVLVGWTPSDSVRELRADLSEEGAALVELPRPAEPPPTLLRSTRLAAPFRVLVDTYGVLPYSNVDPTAFAALAFVVMFGMMFGDLGHGALLALGGLALSRVRHGRLAALRPAWPLVTTGGVVGAVFGILYGELFGPTGILPALWLAPLDEPLALLEAAVITGSVLLSVSYLLGFYNRWREGGLASAVYAEGGLAGGLVFVGIAVAALGWSRAAGTGLVVGAVVAAVGLVLVLAGAFFEAGKGWQGTTRAVVEVIDAVIRIGSNIISFTRLAAFGLMHAALSLVTLQAVQHFASDGFGGWILAALLFLVGTAVALGLEGLVAGIQALRLEYYELFSRVFEEEGRPFTPFTLAVRPTPAHSTEDAA